MLTPRKRFKTTQIIFILVLFLNMYQVFCGKDPVNEENPEITDSSHDTINNPGSDPSADKSNIFKRAKNWASKKLSRNSASQQSDSETQKPANASKSKRNKLKKQTKVDSEDQGNSGDEFGLEDTFMQEDSLNKQNEEITPAEKQGEVSPEGDLKDPALNPEGTDTDPNQEEALDDNEPEDSIEEDSQSPNLPDPNANDVPKGDDQGEPDGIEGKDKPGIEGKDEPDKPTKDPKAKKETANDEEEPRENKEGENLVWIGLLVGGLVILGIVGYLVSKKKPKKEVKGEVRNSVTVWKVGNT